MTPKEKAIQLFDIYANTLYERALTEIQFELCKKCALIAVWELLKVSTFFKLSEETLYWERVKHEIENL